MLVKYQKLYRFWQKCYTVFKIFTIFFVKNKLWAPSKGVIVSILGFEVETITLKRSFDIKSMEIGGGAEAKQR